MTTLGLLNKETTALLVIDVQEKLMPVIHNNELILANVNRLIKGAAILHLPLIVTEQYPKGLGNTCKEVELPENADITEKMCFSCMQSSDVMNKLQKLNVTSLILCGVESHICVFKTALEALENGYLHAHLMYLYWRLRLRHLGIRMGLSIPPGVFGPGLSIPHYGSIPSF